MIGTGLVLGAVLGVGACLVLRGLVPAAPVVARDLADLRRSRWPGGPVPSGRSALAEGIARRLPGLSGAPGPSLRSDLAVTGVSPQRHAVDRLSLLVGGGLLPLLGWTVLAVADVGVAGGALAGAVALGGAGGWWYAAHDLHRRADLRRLEFRHALTVYLDLVNVLLAGGSGVEGALDDAAACGHGWAFSRLRHALVSARLNRESPWTTFDRLAGVLGVGELAELASAVALAGDSGARVRSSLRAKALAMREQALARAQSEAEADSERMSVPLVAMATGFLLLVGYPAVSQVMTL